MLYYRVFLNKNRENTQDILVYEYVQDIFYRPQPQFKDKLIDKSVLKYGLTKDESIRELQLLVIRLSKWFRAEKTKYTIDFYPIEHFNEY